MRPRPISPPAASLPAIPGGAACDIKGIEEKEWP